MENFNELINDELVIVDFFANWCGPCKMMHPVLEEIEKKGIKVVRIDVDKEQELARTYSIMSIPTLLLFKKGKLISTKGGYTPLPLLESWINENRD